MRARAAWAALCCIIVAQCVEAQVLLVAFQPNDALAKPNLLRLPEDVFVYDATIDKNSLLHPVLDLGNLVIRQHAINWGSQDEILVGTQNPHSAHFSDFHRQGKRKIFWEREWQHLSTNGTHNFVSGGRAGIDDRDSYLESIISLVVLQNHPHELSGQISTQLPLGILVRTSYEASSGDPQSDGGKEKEGSESRNKSVGYFEPIAKERRPELGSLLAALIGFALAFPLAAIGADLWDAGRKLRGAIYMALVAFLGFQSTFGILLGFDLWSLGRRMF